MDCSVPVSDSEEGSVPVSLSVSVPVEDSVPVSVEGSVPVSDNGSVPGSEDSSVSFSEEGSDPLSLSEDGSEMIDVIEVDKLFKKSELNKLYFVSDHAAYFKAIVLDNYDGLIGLSPDEFYKEVNKRLSL